MLKIYGDVRSGNCYKIKLLASLLRLDYDWVAIDVLKGETRSGQFLAKNPNGKIPLLELDDGRYLCESNAILTYLASNSRYLPEESFEHAQVMQWLFFEQYSHEPYIAVARFIARVLGLPKQRQAEYESKQAGGHAALSIMDAQLQKTPFMAGVTYTIADIALYAYTHVAAEGGFDLSGYQAIDAWFDRIVSHSDHIAME